MPNTLQFELFNKIDGNLAELTDSRKSKLKNLFLDFLKNGYSSELIGTFYEQSLGKVERKDKGQFYTPKSIVKYILSQLNINGKTKILDPACGCGSFLLTAFELFQEKYGNKLINNIYGVDINRNAVEMTRACLYVKSDLENRCIYNLKNNIRVGNSLISNTGINRMAFDWCREFPDVIASGGFDFVIGNPPYITLSKYKDYHPSESIYRNLIRGPVNAATLMIGKALEVLKKDGILAFLLPKSILYVDSYAKLRDYLLNNTEILKIYDLGAKFKDVRGEQIILFIKKSKPSLNHKIRIKTFQNKNRSLYEQTEIAIKQKHFLSLGKFLTLEHVEYYDLINRISKMGTNLEDYVDKKIFRGLPIGGTKLTNRSNDVAFERVIRGKNILKFKLKSPFFINNELLDTQSKSKINNLKHKKVVVQNIFSSEAGAIAAFDPKGLLSLDTVTNIVVKDERQGKYILALLNSKALNFFLMYALFDRSKLTMHMDKSYIGKLPVISNPGKKKIDKLIAAVDNLNKSVNSVEKVNYLNKIDKIVYGLYSLNKKEIELIESALRKMLSKKSRW